MEAEGVSSTSPAPAEPPPRKPQVYDTRLYERMMGEVPPAHHDVPLFLHCLTEQVAQIQEGRPQQDVDDIAFSSVQTVLDGMFHGVFTDGTKPAAASTRPCSPNTQPGDPQDLASRSGAQFPYLDQAACHHELSGGGKLEALNGQAVVEIVAGLLERVGAPGVRRSGLPEDAQHSAAQRLELQSRIYPFAPDVEPSDIEQLLLVHSFETLLGQVQPERPSCLRDRTVRERVPSALLTQTLHAALRREPFVATAYLPRYDCLLLALYHRALPGRGIWHAWERDMPVWEEDKTPPKPPEVEEAVPEPEVPDPADKKKGGKNKDAGPGSPKTKKKEDAKKQKEEPPPEPEEVVQEVGPQVIEHEVLRTSTIEKLVTPPEGSIILVSRYQRGRAIVTETVVEAVPEAAPDAEAPDGAAAAAPPADEPAQAPQPPAVKRRDSQQKRESLKRDSLQRGATGVAAAAAEAAQAQQGREAGAEGEKAEGEEGAEGMEETPEELPPLGGWCLARVFKDSLTFGMVEDAEWRRLCREERDRQEAARAAEVAARAAARAAEAAEAARLAEIAAAEKEANKKKGDKGKKEEKPKKEDSKAKQKEEQALQLPLEAPEQEPPLPEPFADISFGQLWIAFEDGARCTARMNSELVFQGEPLAEEVVPDIGVVITYTQPSGDTVQVFSNGSVQLSRASAPRRYAGVAWSGGSGDGASRQLPPLERTVDAEASGFQPGGSADVEVARRITPFGTVIRMLLSGRLEVYYPDGTTAWRNPTASELTASLDSVKASLASDDAAWLDAIERLRRASASRTDERIVEAPSPEEKARGLPGHWLVVRRDGSVKGRVPRPPPPRVAESPWPQTDDGSRPGTTDGGAAGTESATTAEVHRTSRRGITAGTESATTADISEVVVQIEPPSLEELLEGDLVDDGMLIEYEVKMVAVATQVELRSRQRTVTNSLGLVVFEDPGETQQVILHKDGTRITRTVHETGYEVMVLKEGLDHVRCLISEQASQKRYDLVVDCMDGSRLEIQPQMLVHQESMPMTVNQKVQDFKAASVKLSRQDLSSVTSGGTGDITISTQSDHASASGRPRGQYTAELMKGSLALAAQGSKFEVLANQSVRVCVPEIEGELPSPRCSAPGQPVRVPGFEDVPAPEDVAEPRLFVVYGDGEAQELHSLAFKEDLLSLANNDPQAVVVESGPLEKPMHDVKCSTIFRTRTRAGLAPAEAASAVELCVGSEACKPTQQQQQGTPTAQESSLGKSVPLLPPLPLAPPPGITEIRQLLEYPPITEDTQTKFLGTLKQYREWEENYMKACAAQAVVVEVKKDKKKKVEEKAAAKKKKKDKGPTEEELLREAMLKKAQEPKFAMDLKLSILEHKVQTFTYRAAQGSEPSNEELLAQAVAIRDGVPDKLEGVEAEPGQEGAQQEMEGLAEGEASPAAAQDAAPVSPGDLATDVPASLQNQTGAEQDTQEGGRAGAELQEQGTEAMQATERVLPGTENEGGRTAEVSPTSVQFSADQTQPEDQKQQDEQEQQPEEQPQAAEAPLMEEVAKKPAKKKGQQPKGQQVPTFSYFKSELGLKFMEEAGLLDRPPVTKPKTKRGLAAIATNRRDPWNPRLVGEAEPEEEKEPQPEAQSPPLPATTEASSQDQMQEQEEVEPQPDNIDDDDCAGFGEDVAEDWSETGAHRRDGGFSDADSRPRSQTPQQFQEQPQSGYPQLPLQQAGLPIPQRHANLPGPVPGKRGSQGSLPGGVRRPKPRNLPG